MIRQPAIMLAAFAVGALVAGALGAGLGVALGVGQVCFAATLVWLLLS